MSKLKKEELLRHLEFMFSTTKSCGEGFGKPLYPPIEQAYKQIKGMIQEPGVTEQLLDKKAKELIFMVANLYPHEGSPCVIPKSIAKDFIRSLAEKIQGEK